MKASDSEAADRPARVGLALPLVIPSQSSGKDAAGGFSLHAPASARHRVSAIAAALGRGRRQLTPALLGIG